MATLNVRFADVKEFERLIHAVGNLIRESDQLTPEQVDALPANYWAAALELRGSAEELAAKAAR